MVHVDDIFPAYNKAGKVLRDKVAAELQKEINIKFMGEADWALKCRIFRDKEKGIMKLCQESFVWEMLTRHNLLNIKPADSPGDPNAKLRPPEEIEDEEVQAYKDYPFREIIGALMWLAQVSRPDIAVVVTIAAMCQHRPSKELWQWIIRICRYLRKTAHWGLVYLRPTKEEFKLIDLLEIFIDVSFAPHLKLLKGKSFLGLMVKFLGATTTWKAGKTKRVLDSSSEAECNGVNEARKENVWQRNVQHYFDLFEIEGPTPVWEDNTAAITLAGSGVYHQRSKHFGIEWYATKEAVEHGEMELKYIETKKQTADFLTKVLSGALFYRHREAAMGSEELQNHFGTLLPLEAEEEG